MKKTNSQRARFLVQSAMIAALYAVLTMVSASMGLAYGTVQFRISEVLTLLPVFTPAAIPGLAIGCLISNLASPLGPVDWVFGTSATLLAAIFSYYARKVRIKNLPLVSALSPVICNAFIIGLEIAWLALAEGGGSLWIGFLSTAVSVGAGELVICVCLGLPLCAFIEKTGAVRRIFN